MADLGDIVTVSDAVTVWPIPFTVNAVMMNTQDTGIRNSSGNKSFSGIVKVNGVASSRTVRIHDRTTGSVISTLTSGVDGTFSFTGVDTRLYYVVALPLTEDEANGMIIDRVQGV